MADLQQLLSASSSGATNVISYPTEAEANAWYYTNFVEFQAFDYGTSERSLNKIIRLPIPEDLQISLNPNWSIDRDATGFFLDKTIEGIKSLNGKVAGGAKAALGALAVAGGKNGFLLNPFQQTYFKFVTFRTIDFNWTLSPKTQEDTKNILEITRTFKYLSLPDFPAFSGILMTYPSEFDITFKFKHFTDAAASAARTTLQTNSAMGGGGGLDTSGEYITNPMLFSLDRCVITNVNLNFAPAGAYSNFADGAPVEIGMQLSFQEVQMLSRRRYMDLMAIHGVQP